MLLICKVCISYTACILSARHSSWHMVRARWIFAEWVQSNFIVQDGARPEPGPGNSMGGVRQEPCLPQSQAGAVKLSRANKTLGQGFFWHLSCVCFWVIQVIHVYYGQIGGGEWEKKDHLGWYHPAGVWVQIFPGSFLCLRDVFTCFIFTKKMQSHKNFPLKETVKEKACHRTGGNIIYYYGNFVCDVM